MTKTTFVMTPQLYILNDPKITSHSMSSELIQTSVMIGKQILMRHWKDPMEPSFSEWFTEIAKVAAYEQMSFSILDRTMTFTKKWKAYLDYIKITTDGVAVP